MDIRQLKYFLAVVDHGGFTRAAEHLLVAQPSLSQTIKGLERDLKIPLFHRIGRQVVLSEAGQKLVGPARVLIRDLDTARTAVDELRGVRSGRLDVVAMPSPGIEPLTSMIATYAKTHPSVTVNVEAAFTTDEVTEAVRSGSTEIGILGSDRPFRSAEVDVMHLEEQPLVLVVNPMADTFRAGESVRREDLEEHRVVVSQRGSLMRWLIDDTLANGVQVEIAAEVAHRTSVLPLVLAGVGHAVLPSSWSPLARQMGLRVARIEPVTVLHIALLSRPTHLTPAARAFLEASAGSTAAWTRPS
ncbi:LysR family transcriptional regulator [Arthrobacter castelli]|uniref:LysR family transcriptional regulator n=1 Tax=Arthrobacter castelli TaxID=271431 RepID=UPI0003FB4A24|nr:LysR family transcriptional regulator [Arthrobacter castelli]